MNEDLQREEDELASKALTFEQAKQLVQAAESRDSQFRTFLAIARRFVRTGRLNMEVTPDDLSKYLWQSEKAELRRDLEAINYAHPLMKIVVDTQAASLPVFSCDPAFRTAESIRSAQMAENLTKMQLEDDKAFEKMRRCSEDAAQVGSGWAHVEYLYEEKTLSEKEWQEDLQAAREEYGRLAMAEGLNPEPPFGFEGEVPRTQVVVSRPTLRYLSPADVFLPAYATEVEDAEWYGYRRVVSLSWAKSNPIFDLKMRKALKHDISGDETGRFFADENSEVPADASVTLYYVYDIAHHTLIVYARGLEKPLFKGKNPNDFDDLCLVHLRGQRDGENLRGWGLLEAVIGPLEKLNVIYNMQIKNLFSQGNVWVANSAYLSDADKRKLESAKTGDLVLLEQLPEDATISQVVEAFPTSALAAEVFGMRAQILEDVRTILGLSEYQMGGAGPSRGSGTQAAVADGQATQRASAAIQAFEQFSTEISSLFLKLSQQHLDEPTMVRIFGPDGESWDESVEVTKYDISGEYTIRIRSGSQSANNPATRFQQGTELLNLVERLSAMGYAPEGLENLTNQALRLLGQDPDAIGLKKLPPTPEQMPDQMGAPMGAPQGDPMAGLPPQGGPMDEMGGQDEMLAAGGPPLPGMDGLPFL